MPKTVTRQRRGCNLNPGPSAPESSTLTNRLPSHLTTTTHIISHIVALLGASLALGKNEETRLDTFEMKGLRKILRVSRTATKTNEWVLNKAGVKRELLDTVKTRKLAYNGHTMKKHELPGERDNARCEEDHTRPGWAISRRGQDSPWKSQSE